MTFINEFETDKILKERFMTFNNPENTSMNFKMNLKVGIFLAVCFSLLF